MAQREQACFIFNYFFNFSRSRIRYQAKLRESSRPPPPTILGRKTQAAQRGMVPKATEPAMLGQPWSETPSDRHAYKECFVRRRVRRIDRQQPCPGSPSLPVLVVA